MDKLNICGPIDATLQMNLMFLAGLAALSLAIALVIDTSSWWIRASCPKGMVGLYVSRSNIYLYFGRFFALSYNVLIAFAIESGAQVEYVSITLAIGFIGAVAGHALLLYGGPVTRYFIWLLNIFLRLPTKEFKSPQVTIGRRRLIFSTAAASFFLSIGIILPLLLAVLVPQYRMSLSYVGQIVNSVGTLLLLFLVDQRLFKSLDDDELHRDLPAYTIGRVLGFVFAGLLCLVILWSDQLN